MQTREFRFCFSETFLTTSTLRFGNVSFISSSTDVNLSFTNSQEVRKLFEFESKKTFPCPQLFVTLMCVIQWIPDIINVTGMTSGVSYIRTF